ncbi:MAG: DEAD/DEAH box helicase [Gordonia amarae]
MGIEATYLADRHQVALWQSHDPATPPPDPTGSATHEDLPLAVPEGATLAVRNVSCTIIEVADLDGRDLDVSARDAVGPVSASVAALCALRDHAAARDDARCSPSLTPLGAVEESDQSGPGPTEHPTPPGALPIAAHAEADPTRTALTSPDYAREALIDAIAAEARLTDLLTATLRPYQVRGIAWLDRRARESGGALLADEMGLGKTVQAIGLLALRRGDGPQLVVAPAGLVSNWQREIDRFAPSITGQVTVISYSRLRIHAAEFLDEDWATVIFDEAQTLKNPRTQVARTARSLRGAAVIALTGTPIENSLDELWAILRIVSPQFFPHRATFRRRFTRAVADGDTGALPRLRAAIAPVMLARTKTQVLHALPAKIDNPVLCDLTDEQARLYDEHLDAMADTGFGSGFERKGRVLATLTRLKQICNHPGLVAGGVAHLSGRSGKFDVCAEILTENVATGSPTLIFTQYRETGDLLTRMAGEIVGTGVSFFHGGLTTASRSQLVADFQDGTAPPVMIMSLKAGGVGLTLTRACDVIHFDRWWNPAVEAQASDRVHRIGQERPVTITTLTTATTLEEHIDAMHRRKSALRTFDDEDSMLAELTALDDERLVDLLRRHRENP